MHAKTDTGEERPSAVRVRPPPCLLSPAPGCADLTSTRPGTAGDGAERASCQGVAGVCSFAHRCVYPYREVAPPRCRVRRDSGGSLVAHEDARPRGATLRG